MQITRWAHCERQIAFFDFILSSNSVHFCWGCSYWIYQNSCFSSLFRPGQRIKCASPTIFSFYWTKCLTMLKYPHWTCLVSFANTAFSPKIVLHVGISTLDLSCSFANTAFSPEIVSHLFMSIEQHMYMCQLYHCFFFCLRVDCTDGDTTASSSSLVKNENCVCKTTQSCPCAATKTDMVSKHDQCTQQYHIVKTWGSSFWWMMIHFCKDYLYNGQMLYLGYDLLILQQGDILLKEVKKEAENVQPVQVELFTVRQVSNITVTCLTDVLKVSPHTHFHLSSVQLLYVLLFSVKCKGLTRLDKGTKW